MANCEKCKNAVPDFKAEKLGIKCDKDQPCFDLKKEEVDCSIYKSRYIEYPITVNAINNDHSSFGWGPYFRGYIGSLVKIRPCGKEYESKTYLGIFIGELPCDAIISHNPDTKVLNVTGMQNPAIYVFSLKKVIFGCESWWGKIENESELKDITDKDIDSVWYVQLARKMSGEENK